MATDALKDVLRAAEKEGARKVNVVRFRIGEDCHAAPENIQFLFRHAARGTIAAGAVVETTVIPGEELILDSIQVD